MKKKSLIFALLLLPASWIASSAAYAAVATPTIEYKFDGDFSRVEGVSGAALSELPACPADPCNTVSQFDTSTDDGYWSWQTTNASGGGFILDTEDSMTTTYTILLKFTFDDYDGYNKIIDYKNRAEDTGFYMHDNKINFYDLGTSANSFVPGEPLTLMVTRTATGAQSGTFKVYSFNGTTFNKELEVEDVDGQSIPADSGILVGGNKLGFFYDDGNGEATAGGKVWSLKIWSGVALGEDDLASAASGETEEPTPTDPPGEFTNELADTGYDATFMLFIGLALVGAGLLTLRASRKKS